LFSRWYISLHELSNLFHAEICNEGVKEVLQQDKETRRKLLKDYSENFALACEFELHILDLAVDAPHKAPPFPIIPDGDYNLRNAETQTFIKLDSERGQLITVDITKEKTKASVYIIITSNSLLIISFE
jgi:hypothetical protein